MTKQFSFINFANRLGVAFALVFITYNFTGWSFYHWALTTLSAITPIKALVGLALLIGWLIFLRATLRSLGAIGIGLVTALFGVLFWMIIDWGFIATDNINVVIFITQVILCFILAIGMSWSHVRRRISGQVDADDIAD